MKSIPVVARDGVKPYAEERSAGVPVVFVHELAEEPAEFNRLWLAFIDEVLVASR